MEKAICLGLCLGLIPLTSLAGGGSGNTGGANAGGVVTGGGRIVGRTSLTFTPGQTYGGMVPQVAGAIGITSYVTTISIDVLASSVNLPNGTPLLVTLNSVDYFTHRPWAPIKCGYIVLSNRRGRLTAPNVFTTAPGLLPVMTSVVVSAPDGSIVAVGN